MATNETPAITSLRLWTRLANWNASLITIRLPSDRRESTKAVGDIDLMRSIENRLRGERVRQQCMAVSEMWEIFNQLAVAAGAAMIMGLYVPHQSEDAVSSKMESGQSPRWRPWLALALENVTSRAFPAKTESGELQSNLLIKLFLDPPPEAFLGASVIYGFSLLSFIQHPRRHPRTNSILLSSSLCGLILGIVLLQKGEPPARVFTKYMPWTILGGQILILGLAVWVSLCNPHEPPSDAKSELHGSGFQTVDTFEDAKIDISP